MRLPLRRPFVIRLVRLGPSRGSWEVADEDGPYQAVGGAATWPQAGKHGDPRSQDADSSPRAQGALGLGFEAKPKGKCGAPRAPTGCGLGRCVAIDWTWASPLPHATSATPHLNKKVGADSACLHCFSSPCSDPLSCALPLKSSDLLPSSFAPATNGAAQGQVLLVAGLV